MTDAIPGLLLIGGAFILYFLPAIIGNDKKNISAIFWLNFLAGWTFIGWIVALMWALSGEDAPQTVSPDGHHLMPVPAATKKCPDCAEEIKAEARKCRFCGFSFDAQQSA